MDIHLAEEIAKFRRTTAIALVWLLASLMILYGSIREYRRVAGIDADLKREPAPITSRELARQGPGTNAFVAMSDYAILGRFTADVGEHSARHFVLVRPSDPASDDEGARSVLVIFRGPGPGMTLEAMEHSQPVRGLVVSYLPWEKSYSPETWTWLREAARFKPWKVIDADYIPPSLVRAAMMILVAVVSLLGSGAYLWWLARFQPVTEYTEHGEVD